jgi:hypothetical protein
VTRIHLPDGVVEQPAPDLSHRGAALSSVGQSARQEQHPLPAPSL